MTIDLEREHATFRKRLGYELDLENPVSFCHKLVWKKLYDRNPLMVPTSDKIAVVDYVFQILGEEAKPLIKKKYWSGNDLNIPFDDLPEKYVVKATHGSKWNLFVTPEMDKEYVLKKCRYWLNRSRGRRINDPTQYAVPRGIIIEEYATEPNGDFLIPYNFHVIHGRVEMITVYQGDYRREYTVTVYDPNWHRLDVTWNYHNNPPSERPVKFQEMIEIAERLGADFDYVRIDLHAPGDRLLFGEISHIPVGGWIPIQPRSYDFEFGDKWHLKPGYWK